MAVKRWVWIAAGILVVLTSGCFVVVGTSLYLASRNIQIANSSSDDADAQFERTLLRFGGQTPLLSVDERGWSHSEELEERLKSAGTSPTRLERLQVMVWQGNDDRLVHVSIPFWILRMSPGQFIHLDNDELDLRRLQVSPADLDRIGPALVLDHEDRHGRILIWTE